MTIRIGYLVPEFPGQTHAFFWREIAALRALGVEAETVSTRRPAAEIVCHEWAREAMAGTSYLAPPSLGWVVRGLGVLIAAGPVRWVRCVRAIGRASGASLGDRVRFGALVLIGAELAALARERRWSHIHAHSCADAAMIAFFASLLSGVPYSLTLHGRISDYGCGQNVKWMNAAFGTTVTQKLKGELLGSVPGLDQGRVGVGAMGVDPGMFTRRARYEPAPVRGPVRIVSCGRLHPGKGHAVLVDAVAALGERGIDASLTILGEGPARAALEAQAARLRVSDRVRLPGAVSEQAVREALEASHVFALASRDEAIGVATMEAMAMGLPVVVTDVGGVSELVRDGVDGVMAPPEDPAAVAAAIEGLLKDPARASAMGAAGAARVRERFHSGVSAAVLAGRLGQTAASGGRVAVAGR